MEQSSRSSLLPLERNLRGFNEIGASGRALSWPCADQVLDSGAFSLE